MAVTVLINAAVYIWLDEILAFLRVPHQVWAGMKEYLLVIFAGLIATSLYNFFSCLLRAVGNSSVPLVFLAERVYHIFPTIDSGIRSREAFLFPLAYP